MQLGFLGEYSFFGELPFIEILLGRSGAEHEIRKRTIRTTCESEMGSLQFDDLLGAVENCDDIVQYRFVLRSNTKDVFSQIRVLLPR